MQVWPQLPLVTPTSRRMWRRSVAKAIVTRRSHVILNDAPRRRLHCSRWREIAHATAGKWLLKVFSERDREMKVIRPQRSSPTWCCNNFLSHFRFSFTQVEVRGELWYVEFKEPCVWGRTFEMMFIFKHTFQNFSLVTFFPTNLVNPSLVEARFKTWLKYPFFPFLLFLFFPFSLCSSSLLRCSHFCSFNFCSASLKLWNSFWNLQHFSKVNLNLKDDKRSWESVVKWWGKLSSWWCTQNVWRKGGIMSWDCIGRVGPVRAGLMKRYSLEGLSGEGTLRESPQWGILDLMGIPQWGSVEGITRWGYLPVRKYYGDPPVRESRGIPLWGIFEGISPVRNLEGISKFRWWVLFVPSLSLTQFGIRVKRHITVCDTWIWIKIRWVEPLSMWWEYPGASTQGCAAFTPTNFWVSNSLYLLGCSGVSWHCLLDGLPLCC